MSKDRLFTFFDTGDWSLDSIVKAKIFNTGKFDGETDLKFYQMGFEDAILFINFKEKKLKCFNPVTGNYVDGWDQPISCKIEDYYNYRLVYF